MSRTSMTGLSEWKKSKEVVKLAKKKPKNDSKSRGLVDLEVEYDNFILKVTVKRMQDLKKMDVVSKSDPYAWVYLTRNDKQSDMILVEKGHEKTVTKKNELNPNFMEEFKFANIDFNELQNYKICVAVYDSDLITADDFIGGVTLPAGLLYQNSGKLEVQFTVPLLDHDTNGHPREVDFAQIGFYGQKITSRQSLSTPAVTRKSTTSKIIVGAIIITIEYVISGNGVLRVKVERCEKLKDEDLFTKSDPYVKVYIWNNNRTLTDSNRERTTTVSNNLNPEFNEYFDFKITEMNIRSSYMVLEVWDDDTISRDDPIGGVMFSMENLDLSIGSNLKLDLYKFKRNEKPTEIYLKKKVVPVVHQYISEEVIQPVPEKIIPIKQVQAPIENCWVGECNDRFVRYITSMQILKDAKLARGKFDNELQVTETVTKSFSRDSVSFGQINISFKERIAEERIRNQQLKNNRDSLYANLSENEKLISHYQAIINSKRSEYAVIKNRVTILEEEIAYLMRMSKIVMPGFHFSSVKTKTGTSPGPISIHYPGEPPRHSSTESRVRITVPIKITDKIRLMLTAHLQEVRDSFAPHINDWQRDVREIIEKIRGYEDMIQRLRLYHPEMDSIITTYRHELHSIGQEIAVVKGDVSTLQQIIYGQESDFNNRKHALSSQFEVLYNQLEQSLIKRGSNFGSSHEKLMRELLELEIYNYLIQFEESRIRDAESAHDGLGPNGDRADVLMESITSDKQISTFTQRGMVSTTSSSRGRPTHSVSHTASRRSGNRSSSSSSDDGNVRRQSNSSYRSSSYHQETVRESGIPITSRYMSTVQSTARRPSNLINAAGGQYNPGGAESVVRGEVASSMSQKGPPFRGSPGDRTSGYVTSPGPLSPGSPMAPAPGSPTFPSPRDSNISDVFSNLKQQIQD